MIKSDPITSDDIYKLEKKVEQMKEYLVNEIGEIEDLIIALKKRSNYKLLTAEQAAEFIGVSKRQIFNLADNPKTQLRRYNTDGSLKTDNRKTSVRFNYIELSELKESRERRKERNR